MGPIRLRSARTLVTVALQQPCFGLQAVAATADTYDWHLCAVLQAAIPKLRSLSQPAGPDRSTGVDTHCLVSCQLPGSASRYDLVPSSVEHVVLVGILSIFIP